LITKADQPDSVIEEVIAHQGPALTEIITDLE
jgi:hypothetical protein